MNQVWYVERPGKQRFYNNKTTFFKPTAKGSVNNYEIAKINLIPTPKRNCWMENCQKSESMLNRFQELWIVPRGEIQDHFLLGTMPPPLHKIQIAWLEFEHANYDVTEDHHYATKTFFLCNIYIYIVIHRQTVSF